MHLDLLGNPSSGGNCYLLSTSGDTLMLDAGLAWSQDRNTGVDFSVPELTAEQEANLSTIAITHPHEDHIGALSYLLKQLQRTPRIVAGPVTAAIIRARLEETRNAAVVETVAPYAWSETKDFRFQAIPVPHSASESMALFLEGAGKKMFYSGDLRGTDETGYGRLPSQALKKHSPLDTLMLEAVRADVDEQDPTLADLKEGLLSALNRLEGRRVIVSAFASNLTRIQIVIELAQSVGRTCYLLGRSMRNAVEMAQQFQRMPQGAWAVGPPPKDATDSKTLLLVAGAQGEPDAGLSRLIRGHYPVQARRGDGLIMSSTPIPGNEEPFWSLVELAMKKGVEVITYRDYLVHLSGHSTAAELQRVMRLLRPKWVIPFHGDYYRHAMMMELGRKVGIPPQRFVQASNGDRVTLGEPPAVEHSNWPVAYYQLGKGRQRHSVQLDPEVLSERRSLLDAGTVVIRRDTRQPRIDCIDCLPEIEEFISSTSVRSRRDVQRIRHELQERFGAPPVVIEIG
jgi:ribonuclease J